MRIMRKLLDNLGDIWNTLPKEVPLFTIEQGTGPHNKVTVDKGIIYFHSLPYHENIPKSQSIIMDEIPMDEFIVLVRTMGYVINYTSEATDAGLQVHKPFILMEVQDVPLAATLTAFTSNLWKLLYPVYRVLRDAEFDTGKAIREWYRPLADGEWLDFWADFFNIKREPNEDDNNFSRRFTMWLFNPKTNNIALEELLSYRLQDNDIEVRDRGALQFELVVGTKYLQDASDLHKILMETKGAGIEYFLNYQADNMEEVYPLYWSDLHGKPFSQMDGKPSWELLKPFEEVFRTPSEAGSGMHFTRAEADDFPEPTDEFMGFSFGYTFTEVFLEPTEENVSEFLVKWAEQAYTTPEELAAYSFLTRREETYSIPPASNVGVAFTVNESLLNEAELVIPQRNPQDTAYITLTKDGVVVESRTV